MASRLYRVSKLDATTLARSAVKKYKQEMYRKSHCTYTNDRNFLFSGNKVNEIAHISWSFNSRGLLITS